MSDKHVTGDGPADLVLLGGNIVTMDPERPRAGALAARGDRVVAVDEDRRIREFVGPKTRVIELGGRLVVPGFIECHAHLAELGEARRQTDLSTARDWDETVALAAAAARKARPGQWVVGRGWHQGTWDRPPADAVEGLPTHRALSAAVPDNPVILRHSTLHGVLVNAAAMRLAGIGAGTPDPANGRLVRDARGEPTGMLQERASALVEDVRQAAAERLTAEAAAAEAAEEIALAAGECLAHGITTVHDAGASFQDVDSYLRMVEAGKLGVRVRAVLNESDEDLAARGRGCRLTGRADAMLAVRAIKRFYDGALGTRSALMLEPYAGEADYAGVGLMEPEALARSARLALELDMQLCVHAIGDRANREVLDAFEHAFRSAGVDGRALRWRVEHAQHLHPDDLPRFARMGVTASMQGSHCTLDGPFLAARLGERRAREASYMWRALLDSGAVVVNGTDAPVVEVDPMTSFHAFVARRLADGSVFHEGQCATREEALCSYTLSAAFSAFDEELLGSLRPGKLADLAVLSRDILSVPEEEIPGTETLYTVVGGRVAHAREGRG